MFIRLEAVGNRTNELSFVLVYLGLGSRAGLLVKGLGRESG
jgi:hypothetical protein